MAQGAFDPNVDLGYYRREDEVNAENERIPEKQTLDARYVSDFLSKAGITAENFDKRFALSTAIDLTSKKHSKGEGEMFDVLTKTKSFLDQRGLGNLLENMNESTTKSNIHFELEKRNELQHEADLQRGYFTYRTIKMHIDRSFKIKEQFTEDRGKEKTKVEKGVKEEFAGVMEDVKKNFSSLEGKEKMLLVVGGLIGAAMLMSSDSPRVARIKETVWTCVKIGGFAWLGNTVFKVFTGKTALDTISDWSKSSVANEAFWTKTFKTDAEQAEILRKSSVYLGDKDFMYLAQEYKKARDLGKNRVEIPTIRNSDMTPEQIYTSLDVFFKRYPVEQLMQKYSQVKPPKPNWREVMGTEMIEDGSIEMSDSLVSRTVDGVKSTVNNAYNWVAPKAKAAGEYVTTGGLAAGMAQGGQAIGAGAAQVGKGIGSGVKGLVLGVAAGAGGVAKGVYEGAKGVGAGVVEGVGVVGQDVAEVAKAAWVWAKDVYRKNFGKEGTDDEVVEWSKKALKNWDESMSGDLEKFLRENNAEKKKADGYVDAMRNGSYERVNDVDVKSVVRDGDSIYVSAGCRVPAVIGNEQGVLEAMKKSDAGAREFLKKKYPQVGDNIDKFIEFSQGVYVVNDNSYKVFVRMPLPGTIEFNQRNAGRWTPEEMKKRKDVETFGTDNKIEYGRLEGWQQRRLRLRFYLDDSQTSELDAVCDKYTRIYNTKGLPLDVVMKRLMENDEDRDAVYNAVKINRNLFPNRGTLESYESKITTIEKDAKGKVVGGDDTKVAFEERMRKDFGYYVRLAILGDKEGMRFMNYDPASSSPSVIRTPEDLLKRYEKMIDEAVKQRQ